jgi:hypothetical protein
VFGGADRRVGAGPWRLAAPQPDSRVSCIKGLPVIEPNLDRVWAALMTGAKPAARRSPFFSSPPRDLKARRRFAAQALRLKCDPRHPGALPDESRRRWRPIAQHRSAGGFEPAGERKVERFGSIFAPGDKVMQIENDYDKEVFNGDIG